MVIWIFVLFAVTLSFNTLQLAAFSIRDAEVIIKIPDECKGQRYCTTQPEHLEGKNNSSVYNIIIDLSDEEVSSGLKKRKREMELGKHNCLDEVKHETLSKYLDEESHDNNFEIIAQSPQLRQLIKVVQCRVLPPPLTNDSNEQCFQTLQITDYGLKSYCETIKARRTLYFYNENKTVMYHKVFNVPIACSCMVSYASEP